MTESAHSSENRLNVVQIAPGEQRVFGETLLRRGLRRLRRDPLTLAAIGVLVFMTLASVFAPFITDVILNVDPNETNSEIRLQPIGTAGHVLGTDDVGRDQLARLLHAGRISLGIGFFGATITLAIGLVFGVIMGYWGGAVDDFMNWVITTIDSVPTLFLLILLTSVYSPSPEVLVVMIALTGWTGTTRLVRAETLTRRNLDYVVSARALGASAGRIMFVHILPNLISILAISLASAIGGLILAESVLSFLGLGIQAPDASWGNMLTKAQTFFTRGPHLVFVPGLVIFIAVLCLYIIGDGVRDAFDPTTQQ